MGKTIVLFLLLLAVALVWAATYFMRPTRRPGTGPALYLRPKPPSIDAWLAEAIAFYRPLGFLEAEAGETDEAVATRLRARLERDWGDSLPSADAASLELFLTESMRGRIWWGDTEADVCMENQVYVEILNEWARISKGTFAPENLTETWAGEKGPVTVTFEQNGATHELHPAVNDDWFDLDVVKPINEVIAQSGRQFVVHIPDQSAVLMCVTPEERRRLEDDRGWDFVD